MFNATFFNSNFCVRDYNPVTGRFISEDPIGFVGGDGNLSRYVFNNPLRYSDPTGFFCVERFLSRGAKNFKTTTNATSLVSDSAAFAVAVDVASDSAIGTSGGRSMASTMASVTKIGEAGKFSTLRKMAPALGKAFSKNIAKGAGTGFALDLAFGIGVGIGSYLEAGASELFNTLSGNGCSNECQ